MECGHLVRERMQPVEREHAVERAVKVLQIADVAAHELHLMQAARRRRLHCLLQHLLRVVEADDLRRLHPMVMRQREHARADRHLEQRARETLRDALERLTDERLIARAAELPEKAVGQPAEQALVLHHAIIALGELPDYRIRIVHDLFAFHLIPHLSHRLLFRLTLLLFYHADSLVDMGFITHAIRCSCFGLPYFCRVSRSISVPSGRKQAISTPASLTQSVR